MKPQGIQKIYLSLTLLNTLAASFIWGVNTLFLLSAGLSNLEAFAANAFFTLGQVIFEVPTGIVADSFGRKISYMLGTLTLSASTLLYLLAWYMHSPFWMWAITSMLLGLGFTFFSGATEAWLVDALKATGFKGTMESVFAKGQIAGGIAMLTGSVMGGYVAQVTNLGVPYIIRAGILGLNFLVAFMFMKDLGFKPKKGETAIKDMKKLFKDSIDLGLRKHSVRWMMFEAPFSAGVGIYAFYAMQPFLLKLYGDPHAYGIAGLAAAIVAGAQIAGGLLVPYIKKLFKRRTSALLTTVSLNCLILILVSQVNSFPLAVGLLVIWGLMFAIRMPIRQAYMNDLIPSQQRATVLSFDSLMGSSGGVIVQPALGKIADIYGYSASYLAGAAFQTLSIPFVLLARRTSKSS